MDLTPGWVERVCDVDVASATAGLGRFGFWGGVEALLRRCGGFVVV